MDRLDASILAILAEHGRASMAEVGRQVGLSRTAALARVQRMEAEGLISGYRAVIAEGAQGPGKGAAHVASIAVVVRTADVRGYVRRLLARPEVTAVESVAGDYDLLVRVATDSAARLDAFLDELAAWRETVRTTTFMVLAEHRRGP